MSKALVILADGFEEIEGLTVVDCLRRGEVDVTTVSIMEKRTVCGSHNITLYADKMFDDIDFASYDAIILPGGMQGTNNLMAHEGVINQIKAFDKAGKTVAAICAAPTVLGKAGILKERSATCYPGCEKDLCAKEFTGEKVTVDGNVITGQAMGSAIDFALVLIENLESIADSDRVRAAIVYKD
ncbi:MAG: DJ-1/PfpI family protein [Eubacterium sp.]|nr:DJ-1/PfpI family protein [Eubacterium sp.]